jgi:hypothetical protein
LAAGGGERYEMPKVAAAQGAWLGSAVSVLADDGGGAGPFVESHTELVRVECSELASGVDIDEK